MKRSPLKRKTPLRQVGRKALREAAALHEFRTQVRIRAGNWCQINSPAGPQGRHEGHDAHHRAIEDRRLGRHDAARGFWACAICHRYLHDHPEESYRKGWLLKSGSDA